MSEQQGRIEALLNLNSGTTTGFSPTSGGSAHVSYDVPDGSTPDVSISVNGHRVAAGDGGLNVVDIAPDGSRHTVHVPQNGAEGPSGQSGQHASGQPTQHRNGQLERQDAESERQDAESERQDAQPERQDAESVHTEAAETPAGHHIPIHHYKGSGHHAAQANVAVYGSGVHAPHITTHKNRDGSLDVTIPKGHGHPHDVTIHVNRGKRVDINITEDKHGHLKIATNEHKPGQHGDWPGLRHPIGTIPLPPDRPKEQATPHSPSTPTPGGAGTPDGSTPNIPLPNIPAADAPKVPATGIPDSGGPSGGGLGGGGGSVPPDVPNGTGQPPLGGGGNSVPPDVPGAGKPPIPSGSGFVSIHPDSIKKLGEEINSKLGSDPGLMAAASKDAGTINVGGFGFGAIGAIGGLPGAHTDVRNAAANQFGEGQKSFLNMASNLTVNANKWQAAEDQSAAAAKRVPTS